MSIWTRLAFKNTKQVKIGSMVKHMEDKYVITEIIDNTYVRVKDDTGFQLNGKYMITSFYTYREGFIKGARYV